MIGSVSYFMIDQRIVHHWIQKSFLWV